MEIEIKIPEVGESVSEAVLVQWYKENGEQVRKGDILFIIETDKVTLEVAAEADGILNIRVPQGETVAVGAVVGVLLTEAAQAAATPPPEKVQPKPPEEPPKPETEPQRETASLPETDLSPSVGTLIEDHGLDPSTIQGTGPGGRITRNDVFLHLEKTQQGAKPQPERRTEPPVTRQATAPEPPADRGQRPSQEALVIRKPMSRIRQRIAERLLEAKQGTAMLTTFNEIDMSRWKELRARFKQPFQERYGVSLGIMSFFIKASVTALKEWPELNAFIDGKDLVYHHYYHIGVAIGAERGLVVPVIRDADRLSFAELEQAIVAYVKKINENRLEVSDLEGGTFTISNGGVYGSLLSTPILNSPQSGILGLHKIEDRPVAVDGRIEIRPMMYVALSYDHRIVDGREAVSFLKRIKECVEYPERIMMEI